MVIKPPLSARVAAQVATPEFRPLSPALGVEVCGIDLARPLEDAVFQLIRRVWEENGVLLFRGQQLTAIKQIRFASRFGSLGKTDMGPPAVLEVSNVRDAGGMSGILPEGAIDFHSDQSYLAEPAIATMLYALEVPANGGNTLFGNGLRAYEALPEDLQQQLAERRALHLYDYETNPTRRPQQKPHNAKRAVHPIFRVHGPTGRRALYVNRLMTWSILDVEALESERILNRLFEHQERGDLVYEHRWLPGDLVLWDNRSCIHARTDFNSDERRRLRRVTVLDDRP
jgi:taurine dioxygenase